MSYRSGVTSIGTAPTLIVAARNQPNITVQNLGAVPVAIGGPGVAPNAGFILPVAGSAGVVIPGVITIAPEDDGLYGCVNSGTAPSNVGWIVG